MYNSENESHYIYQLTYIVGQATSKNTCGIIHTFIPIWRQDMHPLKKKKNHQYKFFQNVFLKTCSPYIANSVKR